MISVERGDCMLTIPFHEILYSALEEDGLSDREFEKILIENGVDNIGYIRISEYKNGATTPPYSKAKTIIDTLGVEMSEEELVESLKMNKEYVREMNSYSQKKFTAYRVSIRMKLQDILPDKEPEQVQFLLDDRIQSLYGSSGKFSSYVKDLIAKDLKQYVIDQEDIRNG